MLVVKVVNGIRAALFDGKDYKSNQYHQQGGSKFIHSDFYSCGMKVLQLLHYGLRPIAASYIYGHRLSRQTRIESLWVAILLPTSL